MASEAADAVALPSRRCSDKFEDRPEELGNLWKPGTRVWSYTGIGYALTLGWKPKVLGRKGTCVAVRYQGDTKVRWLPLTLFEPTKQYDRARGAWHYRWQIGGGPEWWGG
jgi:hypothetical protein